MYITSSQSCLNRGTISVSNVSYVYLLIYTAIYYFDNISILCSIYRFLLLLQLLFLILRSNSNYSIYFIYISSSSSLRKQESE